MKLGAILFKKKVGTKSKDLALGLIVIGLIAIVLTSDDLVMY